MLRIWGRLSSINVQKVVWCAEELGLPYERTEAGGSFGVVDTPQYRSLNPNGLVPVIEDDGFVLWESNAIVRYLSARHGEGSLWPADLRLRAEADRWMDWQNFTYSPAMRDAFLGLVRAAPEKRDPRAIDASRRMAEAAAAILEAHLGARAYVAGAAFTMGDIPVALATRRWFGLPLPHEERPNLRRWIETLSERKGAAGVLSIAVT
jgi:glutathione S-transferase